MYNVLILGLVFLIIDAIFSENAYQPRVFKNVSRDSQPVTFWFLFCIYLILFIFSVAFMLE